MRYEDLSRRQRAELLLRDEQAYYALLSNDQWYLVLDGLAGIKPHKPSPKLKEATWRKLLRDS